MDKNQEIWDSGYNSVAECKQDSGPTPDSIPHANASNLL